MGVCQANRSHRYRRHCLLLGLGALTVPRSPGDSGQRSSSAHEGGTSHLLLLSVRPCPGGSPRLLLLSPIGLCLSVSSPMGGLRAGEGAEPQVPTHRSVDIWGSGAERGLFSLRGLESGLLKQALAAFSSQVQGLEGGEGWSGGFVTSC